jgi:UDP-N-acetylmuramoyl-L-alanyl-D-glutamate--2,6-diaminopimelate ligase
MTYHDHRSAPDAAAGVRLAELVRELDAVQGRLRGDGATVVYDVRQDSRLVQPGDLFVARTGQKSNGLDYLGDALGRGASAVLIERGRDLPALDVPVLEVDNVRWGLALAAEAVHGHPTRALKVVGITGTNGKTTCAWLTQRAIDRAGGRAARVGTLGFSFGDDATDGTLTTPEADDVTRFCAQVRARGATHVVMEASSHALEQYRVHAMSFEVAAFTNLTQDHLDYHPSMQAYAEAKERLFFELGPRLAVVNLDDEEGRRIAAHAPGRVIGYGRAEDAGVRPLRVRLDARGIEGRIALPAGEVTLGSRLVGEHNLQNLLCTLGIVSALGLDVPTAARALGEAPGVPGRLERCDSAGDDLLVLVDYAHTPDALRRALEAVRGLTEAEVICVFGCGGDRDPDKRPKMGDAVGRGANRAIITNDNPRTEHPECIAQAIEAGLGAHRIPYQIILDRSQAIEQAIATARPGDVVLIAGKGHEPYQIFGTTKRPFDDRVEARRSLALRRGESRA